jgi:hypothetical protein
MTNELSRAGKILDELQCEARERVRMGGGRDMEVQSFAMALACDRIAAQDAELERLRAHLTFAAELLVSADVTRLSSSLQTAPDVLLLLSKDPSAVVREGAVYGMSGHVDYFQIKERLREMCMDESPGVREAAEDALDQAEPEAKEGGT